uniref:Uncharacterized protein n=1 Tax=Arundo donax TaxID=35708 RepID=A0A0A9BTR9_ARUDO
MKPESEASQSMMNPRLKSGSYSMGPLMSACLRAASATFAAVDHVNASSLRSCVRCPVTTPYPAMNLW